MKEPNSTVRNDFIFSKILPWLVCYTAALFFFYEFIQLNIFNTLSTDLIKHFHLSPEELGRFSSYYFYAQILFIIPAGLILDRFSIKTTIVSALTLCIVSTYIFSITDSIIVASMTRFLVGFASTFCFLSCLKLIDRWIPKNWTAFASSSAVTLAMLGGMVAQTPVEILLRYFSWQEVLKIDALIGVLILLLIIVIVKNYPSNFKKEKQIEIHAGFFMTIISVLSKRENWLCGIYTSLMNLPIFVFGALWGNSYLLHVNHLNVAEASFVTSMVFLGTIIGAPLMGYFSDKFSSHREIMIFCSIICLILSVTIFLSKNASVDILTFYFLLLGIFSSAQCLSYPVVMQINESKVIGASIGFVGLVIMVGGAVFQPLWGLISEKGIGIKLASYSNEHLSFCILIIGFIISMMIAIFLNKEKAKKIT